jgi:glycine dehydrogenase subunit 1
MRYLPLTQDDRRAMLAKIGARSVDALFRDVPKAAVVSLDAFDLSDTKGELEVERTLSRMAEKSTAAGSRPFFCGGGAYRHHVPAAVDHLIQRSEFLTSYTPYQPEIAQGTLQYLFEFQTQVALLTGMEVANASLYDGSTATAEAVLMAQRVTRRRKAILSGGLHPHYAATVETVAGLSGGRDRVRRCPVARRLRSHPRSAPDRRSGACQGCASHRGRHGSRFARPYRTAGCAGRGHRGRGRPVARQRAQFRRAVCRPVCHARDVCPPDAWPALRRDRRREQHIRREKATSNICTNSGLCCLAFTIHLSLLGEEGLTKLARLNHAKARALADRLGRVKGVSLVTPSFFNEFTLSLPGPAAAAVEALAGKNVLAGIPASRLMPREPEVENLLIVAATETNTDEDFESFALALEEVLS